MTPASDSAHARGRRTVTTLHLAHRCAHPEARAHAAPRHAPCSVVDGLINLVAARCIAMNVRPNAYYLGILVLAACAQIGPSPGDDDSQVRLSDARTRYVDCLHAAAERNVQSPAGAEDIANAAHARCWSEWDTYRTAAYETFAEHARTREEKQFAHDKALAHLRRVEQEARRSVVNVVVERNLKR
jgi:hypothetical protein